MNSIKKSVVIVMSTYNGGRYLDEQLRSLEGQMGVELFVFVRDDGSTDDTHEILNTWSKKGNLSWYAGTNLRSAKSFIDALCKAPAADYYAFCDQDDVWMPDKLARAIDALEKQTGEYKVYISPSTLTDSNLNVIGEMPLNYKYTIGEAIVTNPATGCTMLFNANLKKLIEKCPPQVITMHDEWLYKLCLFMNGTIYADNESRIYYRQHGNNVVGAREPFFKALVRRSKTLFVGGRDRSATLCELRRLYREIIPCENVLALDKVYEYSRSFWGRFGLLRLKGLSAPKRSSMCNFYIAVLLGKF
jgi:rhamnosyltransferase